MSETRYVQCYWSDSTSDWLIMMWYYRGDAPVLQTYVIGKDLVPSLERLQDAFEEAVESWKGSQYRLSDMGGGVHVRYFVTEDDLPL